MRWLARTEAMLGFAAQVSYGWQPYCLRLGPAEAGTPLNRPRDTAFEGFVRVGNLLPSAAVSLEI